MLVHYVSRLIAGRGDTNAVPMAEAYQQASHPSGLTH